MPSFPIWPERLPTEKNGDRRCEAERYRYEDKRWNQQEFESPV
jgi:hypothetical protein